MELIPGNTLVINFDKDREFLTLHEVSANGSLMLYTEVPISKLKDMGLETACRTLGDRILFRLSGTRERLFKE